MKVFLSLPNLTIKNHPPDLALRLWSTERGRRNTKPLVGIGPGSAARRLFVLAEGNLSKSGYFGADNTIV